MANVVEAVKAELKREKIKLWVQPYLQDEALDDLSHRYASRLGAEIAAVRAALLELKQQALAELARRKEGAAAQTSSSQTPDDDKLTLLGKVPGKPGIQQQDIKMEVSSGQSGLSVKALLRDCLGASKVKVIVEGKVLQDEPTLAAQGWNGDSQRGGPLRVILLPVFPEAVDQKSQEGLEREADVTQLRHAAERLTATGFGDFELSDQRTGRLVQIPPSARQPLVTAIALHARGRELLREEGGAARALEFLVEASFCFEAAREQGAAELLKSLSNLGELQLDICWSYALLGDSNYLPDAEARLEIAESMIRRQVDSNFLTLAEVRAEQGRTLPPDVLPAVRLWLLRGIAKACRGYAGAAEDLERAALFLQALQVDESVVDMLVNLGVRQGVTRVQAVAALRRAEGNGDNAATCLLAAAEHYRAAHKERQAQHKFGCTENGSFVDLRAVRQLVAMGMDEGSSVQALKQANNDVSAALERMRKRARLAVDELALATLVSMGYDTKAAEAALQAVGGADVDAACLKLSHQEDLQDSSSCQAAEDTKDCADNGASEEAAADDEARELVERELGRCLKRGDIEDEIAGAELVEEQLLVQRYLSILKAI
ncbi:unnamed protein product [Effrenium voratum]|nr:unnamed protein product [Effrenium voratum]|mmetsp:Transcript_86438/g.207014  ORF Transcript_86438/g.207014 Transcript_86438/m.207014 type:complete len:603 (-) Transcript_86438:60-1868(-)|eukprot:CAMPEP_0181431906 /NCGR_PEP_ID=MMETSP1110-20121109/18494_1 /TAXON_ID=174948 /ORGANISM="Symbiodinium sp., Strain CCMP421" /LENGTH=602 /DNA_ID=CAMNT_0023555295 /DNA_START=63 /DNA_END=1871 /DNA_ORIENTATION=-